MKEYKFVFLGHDRFSLDRYAAELQAAANDGFKVDNLFQTIDVAASKHAHMALMSRNVPDSQPAPEMIRGTAPIYPLNSTVTFPAAEPVQATVQTIGGRLAPDERAQAVRMLRHAVDAANPNTLPGLRAAHGLMCALFGIDAR